MQGLTLTATIAAEKCHVFNVDLCQIQWKSRLRSSMLKEYVEDNYYARFDTHSYHCCREMPYSMVIYVKVTGKVGYPVTQ